jgi:sigma-70-like protein
MGEVYDDWAAARTPELLRLARALTGDDRMAEDAVRRALTRTRTDWARIVRDDPDLAVRRLLVRSHTRPERAAVVLREAEHLSDTDIADVLGCSESAARHYLARGLAAAGPAGVVWSSDADPSGPGTGGLALLERVEVDEGREPRRRGRVVHAAVLAVVLLLGGVALVSRLSQTPAGVISYPSTQAPQSWRYESYAGVQVQVPATWGWGGAPLRMDIFHGKDHLGSCGSSTAAVPSSEDPSSYVSNATAFTGRPMKLSNTCVPWGSDGTMPSTDALWFASPLDGGRRDVGSVVAETRAVGDQHITVFSAQSALRRQILGTARLVDTDANGCPSAPVVQPAPGPAGLRPGSLSVCAYSQDTGTAVLLWSSEVSGQAAQRYAGSLRRGSAARHVACPSVPSGTWVALGLHGDGGTRWDLVDLTCSRIRSTGNTQWPLTPATVRDWGGGGVAAYVPQPTATSRDLEGFFRPALP